MREFKPVFWPVPVFVRDELKPTRRGSRAASNYGLWIVMSREAMEDRPWILEQEKFESRYWFLRGFGLYYLFCRLFYPAGLCRVECRSRAQEMRARRSHGYEEIVTDRWAELIAKWYARSIHRASNYDFFRKAGWTEDDIYEHIMRYL